MLPMRRIGTFECDEDPSRSFGATLMTVEIPSRRAVVVPSQETDLFANVYPLKISNGPEEPHRRYIRTQQKSRRCREGRTRRTFVTFTTVGIQQAHCRDEGSPASSKVGRRRPSRKRRHGVRPTKSERRCRCYERRAGVRVATGPGTQNAAKIQWPRPGPRETSK